MELIVGKKYRIEPNCRDADLKAGEYTVTARHNGGEYFCVNNTNSFIDSYCTCYYTFTPVPEFKVGDKVDITWSCLGESDNNPHKLHWYDDSGYLLDGKNGNRFWVTKGQLATIAPHIPKPKLETGAIYKAVHKRCPSSNPHIIIGQLVRIYDNSAELHHGDKHNHWARLEDYDFIKYIESK